MHLGCMTCKGEMTWIPILGILVIAVLLLPTEQQKKAKFSSRAVKKHDFFVQN